MNVAIILIMVDYFSLNSFIKVQWRMFMSSTPIMTRLKQTSSSLKLTCGDFKGIVHVCVKGLVNPISPENVKSALNSSLH